MSVITDAEMTMLYHALGSPEKVNPRSDYYRNRYCITKGDPRIALIERSPNWSEDEEWAKGQTTRMFYATEAGLKAMEAWMSTDEGKHEIRRQNP
jgi:hypothetical protein